MAMGLGQEALAGVDQHDRQVRVRRAGRHVAGVLLVAGSVGDDERANGRREVAVGDVDGDALFPFGFETVDEQGEIDVVLGGSELLGVALERGKLIVENQLLFKQQAADEGGLPVVHRAAGQEFESGKSGGSDSLVHQKYPSRFFFSIDAGFVGVDQPPLPFGLGRGAHFGDDVVERVGVGFDGAGQRIATEGTEPHARHARLLARFERQAVVIDHDERARALDHRTRLGEIKRNDGYVLGPNVFPHVEFGPIGQREDPHRLALANARVEQPPQLRALIARIPGVRRGTVRENALLGAALFLVAPRPAEGRVVAALLERLAKRFRLHHMGVDLGARSDGRYSAPEAVLVHVHDELEI